MQVGLFAGAHDEAGQGAKAGLVSREKLGDGLPEAAPAGAWAVLLLAPQGDPGQG